MTKLSVFLCSLVFILMAFSCDREEPTPTPMSSIRSLSADETGIAASANNFAFELMTELENDFPNENYFISPFSVSTAISMVMNGADQTSQEGFIRTLGLSGMSPQVINEAYHSLVGYVYGLDPSVTINVANSNWYADQYTISASFSDDLSTYYNASLFERDFSSTRTLDELNGWVEDETNGKIKNILDGISPDDIMFLINAIYFKANWTTQFAKEDTENLPFVLPSNETVDVPMMVAEAKHWWSYDSNLKAQVIDIPYGNEIYAFTVIMPDDVSDIHELVSKINIHDLTTTLSDSVTLIRELYLPKFNIEFKTDLLETLVNLGMPVTGLDNLFEEDPPVKISKVIHQSFLEVDEKGSEAAAATVVGIELTSLPSATYVNQPFIFLIRERNSGTILFSGKLLDPTE